MLGRSSINRMLINRSGAVLDELEPQRRVPPHEPLDDIARRLALFIRPRQRDLDQAAACGVHGGFLELVGVHFAEALEAADFDLLALELGRFELGAVGVVAGVEGLGAGGQAIERWLGEEEVTAAHQLRHFLEEEGHQQGRDVGAVDVGVGHDDDTLVAERVLVELVAGAAAKREIKVGDFAVGANLLGGGGGDVEDLPPNGEDRLSLTVPRLLGGAARAVAFDDEQLGAFGVVAGAVGELAGEAELAGARRRLSLNFALGAALEAFFHALDDRAQKGAAAIHIVGEEMVEMVADGGLDEARGFQAGEAVLGLALEMRVSDEDAEHQFDAVEDVVGLDVLGALVADELAERADALGQRGAKARLVGAAVGGWDRVAVVAFAAVGIERPGDGPFGAALRG